MANFDACMEWVLRQEDSTLSGKVVTLADGAGRTRFGISEKNHPNLPADFYTCDSVTALAEAKVVYRANEWSELCGDALNSDEVAATLLSFAVNDGERFEAKVFQRLLGVPQDGAIGPHTIMAANAQPCDTLAANLRTAQTAHYRALVVADPNDEQFLKGWLRRAAEVYPN